MPKKKKKMGRDEVAAFNKNAASYRDRKKNERYRELRGRRAEEMERFQRWIDNGKREEDLMPLLESLDPIIESETRKRIQGLGGSISKPALKNELRNHAVTALHTYDPNKGTQLPSHIYTNFQRVTDFVAHNRNERRVPRSKVERYQEYENAKNEFEMAHGREPTELEMQRQLPGWKPKDVREIGRAFGRAVYTNMGTPLDGDDDDLDDLRGVFLTARPFLTAEEKEFGERFFPPSGKRQMSVESIARAMRIPNHKAYRIKKRVEEKLAPMMRNR